MTTLLYVRYYMKSDQLCILNHLSVSHNLPNSLHSYPLDDGTQAHFTYTADENGYQPLSALLPVAPVNPHPMPAHALRQIEKARLEQQEARAREEVVTLHTGTRALQEAARLEAETRAFQEAVRLEAETRALQEAARHEAETLAQQEAARLEAETRAIQEAARLDDETRALQATQRLEDETRTQEVASLFEGGAGGDVEVAARPEGESKTAAAVVAKEGTTSANSEEK